MVRLETAIDTVLDVFFEHDLRTELADSIPVAIQPASFPLPDVSSPDFQTILLETFGLENVGMMNVEDIRVFISVTHSGNGEFLFDMSGDGGQSFVTVFQNIVISPVSTSTASGGGTWIKRINVGDEQLQFRLRSRSLGGVFSTAFVFGRIILYYRKSSQL